MEATGANINENKSRALALGSWSKAVQIMNIRYDDNIKILGFQMTTNSKNSAKLSWMTPTSKIRSHARENYHRTQDLASRIRYVNEVLLATAWYKAQIPPSHRLCTTDKRCSILLHLEGRDLQISIIYTLSTLRFRRQRPNTLDGEMHDPLYTANGKAMSTNRLIHGRLDHEMEPSWKITKPPRHNEGTEKT
jgi:hypothetical protein